MCYLPKQEEEDVTLCRKKKNFPLVAFRCLFHIERMGVEVCQNWTLRVHRDIRLVKDQTLQLVCVYIVCVEKEKDVISRTEDIGIHIRAPTQEEDACREG